MIASVTISARTAKIANWVAAAILLLLVIVPLYDPGIVLRSEFAKQRILLGADSHTIVVGDHRWVYAELPADAAHADAPTVVFLHGFTGSKENWYRMARALRGRYRLVMPDLPGWGQSERKPDADYSYLAQSERVAEFIRALDGRKGRPVVLIGHSMGGGIAALTAAHHPTLIGRVGLISASGVRFKDNAFGREVLAGKNPFALSDQASLEHYLSTVFHSRETRPWLPWPATYFYIAKRKRDAAFEQKMLGYIGRSEGRFLPGEKAGYIAQPTLLLWCDGDKVIDPSALVLYSQRIKHASRVLLYNCGHMPLMERPGETAEAVAWLIEHGAPGESKR